MPRYPAPNPGKVDLGNSVSFGSVQISIATKHRAYVSQPGFSIQPLPRLPAQHIMALTLDDVHRIAHLARIEIDEAAAREVHGKLLAIFAMINTLQAVDTTGIVPMSHAQDVMLPLREDVVTASDQRALFQSVAPAVQDGLYLVPRVVE